MFLHELEDDEFRDGFVADHVRTRFALLVRTLREKNGWSQAELGARMGKPQSVVSRIENPDYGRLSTQTIFEVAAAFKLPVYIDLPNWDEWFRLMEDMSSHNLQRSEFDVPSLLAIADSQAASATLSQQSGSILNRGTGLATFIQTNAGKTGATTFVLTAEHVFPGFKKSRPVYIDTNQFAIVSGTTANIIAEKQVDPEPDAPVSVLPISQQQIALRSG